MRRTLSILAGILIIAILWAALAWWLGPFVLPNPWQAIFDFFMLMSRPAAWLDLGFTLLRVSAGFSGACLVGSVVGAVIGLNRTLNAALKPVLTVLQGIPPILWAIPLVIMIPLPEISPIVMIAVIVLPLVSLTIAEGMRSVPLDLKEMLKIFAPHWRARFWELYLPHLRPFLLTILNLGLALAIKASVVAEFFSLSSRSRGLGFQINQAYSFYNVRALYSWALLLVMLIIISQLAINKLLKYSKQREYHQDRGPLYWVKPQAPAVRGRGYLSVRKLNFAYQTKTLLRNINLEVGPQEIAVISGDSGCGKTTLLQLIAGLLKPVSGSVTRPLRLGYVFQDHRLLPWFSALRNTALPLRYLPVKEAAGKANYFLGEMELTGHENDLPAQLSGGMKKRLVMARCFAVLPEIILLDEPFVGLDKAARQRLWRTFRRLWLAHPVPAVLVTHYPEEIRLRGKITYYQLGMRGTLRKIPSLY